MSAPAFAWEDAYRPDLSSADGARRAVKIEISASRHYPAEVWAPDARKLASDLDAAGFTILAAVLRRHVGRILSSRPTYSGRRV